MLRGGMISLLYNKTLQLRDGLSTQSAVLTHMSTGKSSRCITLL